MTPPQRVLSQSKTRTFLGGKKRHLRKRMDFPGGRLDKFRPKGRLHHQAEAFVERGGFTQSGGDAFKIEKPAAVRSLR